MSLLDLFTTANRLDDKYGFDKTAQVKSQWIHLIGDYETGAAILDDLHGAMKQQAHKFWDESEKSENDRRVFDRLLKQAHLINNLKPEMEALDNEVWSD